MTEYPDPRLGPLGPKDKRFPMPGQVGTTVTAQSPVSEQIPLAASAYPDVLTAMLPHERQANMLQQYLTMANEVC